MKNVPRLVLEPKLHKAFLQKCLQKAPSSLDSNRVVYLFFVISGLDILDRLDVIENRRTVIDWIYSLQIINNEDMCSGFQGSSTLNTASNRNLNTSHKWSHIACTYAALVILLILEDDFGRVNKSAIIDSLKSLQLPDGSFKGSIEGAENDMRFVYCACCISYILDDFSAIDINRMVDYILKSISYDGGVGQGPNLEAHSGSTFCAIASLALTKQLDRIPIRKRQLLIRWLVNRLDFGFNGRPNKASDTCYSFWTGGTLKILNAYHYLQSDIIEQYVLMCQNSQYGGFAKYMNSFPDPMHTHLGLAGLSIMNVSGLNSVFCNLNVTERTHRWLLSIHEKWQCEKE